MLWMSFLGHALAAPPTCVTVTDGQGCLEMVRGWRVLDVHGTDKGIGRTYGALLGRELTDAWVPMTEHAHYGALPGSFRGLFLRFQRHFPDYFDARADARAQGLELALHLEPGTVRRFAWLADLASIGPGLQLATGGTVEVDGVTGGMGCTSAVGRLGEATVHARNLDFWGMGYWQPFATLLFVEPLDAQGQPDGLRYAQVGTVGEVFAGSSGVNEAGLVVTSHLHVTRDTALAFGRLRLHPLTMAWEALSGQHPRGGTAIYVIFERLLRDARNVPDAIALLQQLQPVGAWSFVLSDPSGDHAVVATNWRQLSVSRAQANTNFYFDQDMQQRERLPARGPLEGARMRYARADVLLPDGDFTVEQAVALLRDRFDAAVQHDRAVSANTVLSPDTSQSAVFVTHPDGDHELWLAEPHADGYTPAALAPFVKLSFRDGFAPGRKTEGEVPYVESPLDALTRDYLGIMRQVIDVRDWEGAGEALVALQTEDPGLRLMSAWAQAGLGDLTTARFELDRMDRAAASEHHQALAAWLDGELKVRTGDVAGAQAAWRHGLAILAITGPQEHFDEPLRAVLADRLAGGRRALPFPDLKFQDVLELRLGR